MLLLASPPASGRWQITASHHSCGQASAGHAVAGAGEHGATARLLGLCRTCAKRVICRSSPPCTLWTSDDLMKSVAITVRSYRGWPHDGAMLGVLDAHLGEPLDAKKTTSGAVRLDDDDQFSDPSRHRHRICRLAGDGSGPVPANATWQACPDMIAQSRSILTMRDCPLQRRWARPAGPRRPHGPSKA
jgi:hypothetical protein